ncbi:primosomal protein N' [bioreactor metagenome]|uniref:DNA 3'-5' helicase n=1 Tax=bioreactor metagenome TaxID=1076179 RepID=A0A645A2H9_9ZZZZ
MRIQGLNESYENLLLILNGAELTENSFSKNAAEYLIRKKLLARKAVLSYASSEKSAKFIRLSNPCNFVDNIDILSDKHVKKAAVYAQAAKYLSICGIEGIPLSEFLKQFGISYSGLSTMSRFYPVETFEKRLFRPTYIHPSQDENITQEFILNAEQEKAAASLGEMLDSGVASCALLHGVTGSGKTMVMLSLIDRALKSGKGVIMLVPEIALTGRASRLLLSRYGDKVAVIHSGLSDGERFDEWTLTKTGKKTVVLGTRSSIFAPVQNLGLIIIDEEHDQSYKSDTRLKYHARDVARFLCAKCGALLLLSSATPDIESYYKAETGKYRLLNLTERFNASPMPDAEISDIRNDIAESPDKLIGARLGTAIRETLSRGEQIILFMNRRGYRHYMMCRYCGGIILCPNCSVSMTLHNPDFGGESRLMCHYCGYTEAPPEQCPSCGHKALMFFGYGTQKLEEQLKTEFTSAHIIRMDSDTVTKKHSHDEILSDFKSGKADILIGTQMVAKGHNFPNVTLVGIVSADSSLYLSDYRAYEQTFSLLTQVIGRAGRAELSGRAIIQTMNPDHEIIRLAASQDYLKFYKGEIAVRKALLYPPFCEICALILSGQDEKFVKESATYTDSLLGDLIKSDFTDVKLIAYGPFEAMPYKLNNTFRLKFVFKLKSDRRTREYLNLILSLFAKSKYKSVIITIDMNPGII